MPMYRANGPLEMGALAQSMNPAISFDFFSAADGAFGLDLRTRAANVRCPTLVIGGDRDPIVPQELQEELFQCLPEALRTRAVISPASHFSFDNWLLYRPIVESFIAS